MDNTTKHTRVRIREILDELATPVMSDKEGAESWIKAIDHLEKLVNQQVLIALAELKSKQRSLLTYPKGLPMVGVGTATIEELERKYQ